MTWNEGDLVEYQGNIGIVVSTHVRGYSADCIGVNWIFPSNLSIYYRDHHPEFDIALLKEHEAVRRIDEHLSEL